MFRLEKEETSILGLRRGNHISGAVGKITRSKGSQKAACFSESIVPRTPLFVQRRRNKMLQTGNPLHLFRFSFLRGIFRDIFGELCELADFGSDFGFRGGWF